MSPPARDDAVRCCGRRPTDCPPPAAHSFICSVLHAAEPGGKGGLSPSRCAGRRHMGAAGGGRWGRGEESFGGVLGREFCSMEKRYNSSESAHADSRSIATFPSPQVGVCGCIFRGYRGGGMEAERVVTVAMVADRWSLLW